MSQKPVFKASYQYADCLEKSFGLPGQAAAGTASAGGGLSGASRGAMSNTPLITSTGLNQLSEDTAYISVWARIINQKVLFERLERCQREVKRFKEDYLPENEEEMSDEAFLPAHLRGTLENDEDAENTSGGLDDYFIEGHGKGMLEFGNTLWQVAPYGKGGKNQDSQCHYRYVFYSGGIKFHFRENKSETVSNIWIEIGSIPLVTYGGLKGVWEMLLTMFKQENIVIEKDILSRVDMYADTELEGVETFCKKFENRCRITRARSIGNFGEEELNTAMYLSGKRYTGFSIGKNIKLRCYDKRYEMRNDPVKWGYFAEKYNGIPETLTRIEFQLRRNALKDFFITDSERIDGVESYLIARDKLWKYLTEEWFRLTEDEVDSRNNNQSKAKVWAIWTCIQNAVQAVSNEVFILKRLISINFDHLADMALGCICKLAVWKNAIYDKQEVLSCFSEYLDGVSDEKFIAVMEKHNHDKFIRVGMLPAT